MKVPIREIVLADDINIRRELREETVEHAVWGAALAHGLIQSGMSPEAGWTEIDDIASSALGKDAGSITSAEWAEFAVRIAASEFDPAPARPR